MGIDVMKWLGAVLGALAFVALAAHAVAQQQSPDWCAAPLSLKDSPEAGMIWQLRCAIQKLTQERANVADNATEMEVEKAKVEAYRKDAAAELSTTKAKLADAESKLNADEAKLKGLATVRPLSPPPPSRPMVGPTSRSTPHPMSRPTSNPASHR
jgi:septal ring factor EnvC (AmiA/AmiB activator)